MLGALLVAAFLGLTGQTSPLQASPCSPAPAAQISSAAMESCLGEEEMKLGDAARSQPTEQSRHWQLALTHYRRAVDSASSADVKKRGLNSLVDLLGQRRLNDIVKTEGVMRELIALEPNELSTMFRLSRLLEDRDLFDAAEDLLLSARHQAPFALEPYQMLAQFYARRSTAIHKLIETQKGPPRPTPAGEPDEQGIYRVGGAIPVPHKLDNPVYPPEAQAAGIDGVVAAEIVVNQKGEVIDGKVLRSVPLLDDAALKAIRYWRYEPTIVNGQPVPVRLTVTVNFTKSR